MVQKGRGARSAALTVTAAIEAAHDGAKPPQDVAVYAYSAGGRLLASAPLGKTGAAALELPLGDEVTAATILIGPRLDQPDLGELLRRGAHEQHVRLDPKKLEPITIPVPHDIWPCWFLGRCTVRGTVLRRTTHDGQALDLPVCGAEVEIYEVDPISVIVPRLPDHVIDAIRDALRRPIPIPDPPPFEIPVVVGPPPGPGPGPDPAPLVLSAGPAPHDHAVPAGDDIDVQVDRAHEMARALSAPAVTPLTIAAGAASRTQLREVLVANPEVTRLLLCRLRPTFVTKTLIGTATTDQCGHFRHTFFRGCHNPDQPDLYFRVLQPLFLGIRIPIHDPKPVACHTRWNYVCGTQVTIHTTSPFAHTCSPCPPLDPGGNGAYVAVMHVGNLLTSNIHGVRTPAPSVADRGLTIDGRPFGATLNPHLEFDPELREQLGVRYYRVTVQQPGGGSPRELDAACYRHFRHDVAGGQVVEPFLLGPKTIGGTANLYEIPPAIAPQGVWSIADAVEDMANAKWDSTMEAPGRPDDQPDRAGTFELKIELFDAAGALVDPGALGITWLVPRETSAAGAAVLHLDPPAPGVVQGGAFLLPLHVDNNACSASIDAPVLNGSAAADQCGVLRYQPPQSHGGSVVMPHTARHRNGHATFSFVLKRGTHVLTPPTTSGPVGPGTFSPSETVLDLLSRMPAPQGPLNPPCTIGAFLEEVGVHATATNGWSTLTGYNAYASRAFTLAPR